MKGPVRSDPLVNALPEDGLYSRVMNESRANRFLNHDGILQGNLILH